MTETPMTPEFITFLDGLLHHYDPGLALHHHAVAKYSGMIGAAIGMSSEDLQLMNAAARIHDLGKVAISTLIINKPAPLTPLERIMVQKHPCVGIELLEPMGFELSIIEAVQYHHENYDGSGYPNRVKGENIPFMARIIRIADSFDALIEDRPYHERISNVAALNILRKDEKFYDPDLLIIAESVLG